MREFSATMFPLLTEIHAQLLANAIDRLEMHGLSVMRSQTGEGDVEDLELLLLCFRSISTIMIYGFQNSSLDPLARVSSTFFSLTVRVR